MKLDEIKENAEKDLNITFLKHDNEGHKQAVLIIKLCNSLEFERKIRNEESQLQAKSIRKLSNDLDKRREQIYYLIKELPLDNITHKGDLVDKYNKEIDDILK